MFSNHFWKSLTLDNFSCFQLKYSSNFQIMMFSIYNPLMSEDSNSILVVTIWQYHNSHTLPHHWVHNSSTWRMPKTCAVEFWIILLRMMSNTWTSWSHIRLSQKKVDEAKTCTLQPGWDSVLLQEFYIYLPQLLLPLKPHVHIFASWDYNIIPHGQWECCIVQSLWTWMG